MNYCETCFVLIRAADGICARCGRAPNPAETSIEHAPEAGLSGWGDDAAAGEAPEQVSSFPDVVAEAEARRLSPQSEEAAAAREDSGELEGLDPQAFLDILSRAPARSTSGGYAAPNASCAPALSQAPEEVNSYPMGEGGSPTSHPDRLELPRPVQSGSRALTRASSGTPAWTSEPATALQVREEVSESLPPVGAFSAWEAAPPAPPPLSAQERRLRKALQWTRRSILAIITGTGLVLGIRTLSEMNMAAQASWNAQGQIGAMQIERQGELSKAFTTLQDLHLELRKRMENPTPPSPELAGWRRRWREQLVEVRRNYRLDGQVGYARSYLKAEEALRNATVYLGSIEQTWAGGQGQLPESLTGALQRSFDDARADLY